MLNQINQKLDVIMRKAIVLPKKLITHIPENSDVNLACLNMEFSMFG